MQRLIRKIKQVFAVMFIIFLITLFTGCTMVTDEPRIVDGGSKAILRGWSAFGSTNNSYYFAFDSEYHDDYQNYSELYPASGPHDVYNYYHFNTPELEPGIYHYRFVRHHTPSDSWYQGDDVNFTISP